MKQIMASTPGFDIVYDRGGCVLDVDINDGVSVNDERRKFESVSGVSFPVIRKEYWERALNQAQQDHERNQSIQQDVHGENRNTFEHVQVQILTSPRKRNVSPMKAHIVRFVHRVRSASRPEKHAKQVGNPEHIPVIEFDSRVCNRHAWWPENFDDGCDRLTSWIDFCCYGKEKGWPG